MLEGLISEPAQIFLEISCVIGKRFNLLLRLSYVLIDTAGLLFLCQEVVTPALDVIGFKSIPFLAEALVTQSLHFADFVDTPFEALGNFINVG